VPAGPIGDRRGYVCGDRGAGCPACPRLTDQLSDDRDLHAPHLLDVEVIHALRGLVHGGKISEEIAADVRMDFADLAVVRYPRVPLSDRMWELRHAMTAYDAAFVALSEALGAPLVTCDSRLAATSSHSARIELFPPA
jgi:predicted nucleic acid-binding protein